jgi:sister-chromatid-cohesion protein PDS5
LKRLTGLAGYARGGSPYRAFVDFCEANNVSLQLLVFWSFKLMRKGGVIDQDEAKVKARLEFVISALSRMSLVPKQGWAD